MNKIEARNVRLQTEYVGVNTGKNENPRRNDAIAKGDVSKAHGQALARRIAKNVPNVRPPEPWMADLTGADIRHADIRAAKDADGYPHFRL